MDHITIVLEDFFNGRVFMISDPINDARLSAGNAPVGLHGYDAVEVSDATGLDTGSETIVQQHYGEEVDINTIVRRFGVTGALPLGPEGPAIYGDFTGITDYESARDTIERANTAFMNLPADVRLKFDNDPAKLIAMSQSMSEEAFSEFVSPPVVDPAVGS